jgi:hypothetical protein
MSTGLAGEASAMIAAFSTGDRGGWRGVWKLERAAVARRLGELVAEPGRFRQGRLNLCGPAALFSVWFDRDPVAAVRFGIDLFETGRARLGPHEVVASPALRDHAYGQTDRGRSCPQADWMLMASLRDSSNKLVRYSRPGGLREPAAAITMPGAMRRWLTATGCYESVVDETNLVRRKGIGHVESLVPTPGEDVFLLVALEMFRRPAAAWRRARDRVVSLVPNHWVLLRSPVRLVANEVHFAFWSWAALHEATLERSAFERCYYGALRARTTV